MTVVSTLGTDYCVSGTVMGGVIEFVAFKALDNGHELLSFKVIGGNNQGEHPHTVSQKFPRLIGVA